MIARFSQTTATGLIGALLCMWGLLFMLLSLSSPAYAQKSWTIENTAYATFEIGGVPQPELPSNEVIVVIEVPNTPSELELLRYSPADPSAQLTLINGSDALIGGIFTSQPAPTEHDGSPDELAYPLALAPAVSIIVNEPIFVRVSDADANLDPTVIDTVTVVISVSDTADEEALRLYETGPDTGVFVGFIQTANLAGADDHDGILTARPHSVMVATYQDASFPDDVATDSAVVEASARVFNSETGELIDGAIITIVDAATGEPAEVTGIDRVSAYPSTVVAGKQVVDASRRVYVFDAGEYRFPVVPAGGYIITVTPPQGYTWPSIVPDQRLQQLPGAPFHLDNGSRGQRMQMATTTAILSDIPLDPAVNLKLEKSVSTSQAETGDFLHYELSLTNSSGRNATSLVITDALPYGFRYQKGSMRLNGEKVQPRVHGSGDVLELDIAALADGETVAISYVVEVTVAAPLGKAVNTAVTRARGGFRSNIAEAEVRVADPFMRHTTTIVGRVSADACDPEDDWPRKIVQGESVPNVRLYMEDGTFVVTDEDGQYNFRGLKPGVHVVQIDTLSLPTGYEPVLCEENTRFAGTPNSQMVDLRGGALWRADFYLRRTPAADAAEAERAAKPTTTVSKAPTSAQMIEAYGKDWLAGQSDEIAWVYPDPAAGSPIPNLRFGIKHAIGDQLAVFLNGEKLSAHHVADTVRASGGNAAITHWRGVDIRNGGNSFTVIVTGRDGREKTRLHETIYFIEDARKVSIDDASSVLIADGRTSPEIALRVTDLSGRTVRSGRKVRVQVEPPYRAQSAVQRFEDRPLTEKWGAVTEAEVGDDGYARVILEPTGRTGSVSLTVTLEDPRGRPVEKTVEAWLSPGEREWILVGLAEGTVAFNQIKGAMRPGGGDDITIDGRLAFFAQGSIRGDWLLTLAYDSDRRRGSTDDELYRDIDPNAYYTLYGDATAQQNESESRYPLYLKIERKNFYALFGDFDTGFADTELANVSRQMSGLKAEYRDERFNVIAFGSETSQAHVLEEILSVGTSGPYRLKAAPIVRNSEEVTVETRDRFRNDIVLSTTRLVRYVDYTIDYDTGVVILLYPIPVTDPGFNPNVLSFSYEAVNPVSRNPSYGVRATVRGEDDAWKLGATYVHEGGALGDPDLQTDLFAVDVEAKLNDKVTARAEYATSSSSDGNSGDAFLIDLEYETELRSAHAYIRQVDEDFRGSQMSGASAGTRIVGAEYSEVIRKANPADPRSSETRFVAEGFHETALSDDASRTVLEAGLEQTGPNHESSIGLRFTDHSGAASAGGTPVTQLVWGTRRKIEGTPMTAFTTNEWAISGSSANDFDNRTQFGTEYRFNDRLTGTVAMEYSEGGGRAVENVSFGLTATPWKGGTLTASLFNTSGPAENGDRLAGVIGLGQTVQLTEKLSISAGLEHQRRLHGGKKRDLPASPFTEQLDAEEFTVANLGFGYQEENWSASGRIEYRTDETQERLALDAGVVGDFNEDLSAAAWIRAAKIRNKAERRARDEVGVSVAAAYRPLDRRTIFLNRLDAEYSSEGGEESIKMVNNFTANGRIGERGQASIHLGAKYQKTTLDGNGYDGLSYFIGSELRYDLAEKFDIGLMAGIAQSLNSGVTEWAWGPEIGYNMADNVWLSVGYNFEGITDEDFGAAEYRSKGLYLKFRMNFDQDSVRRVLTATRMQ